MRDGVNDVWHIHSLEEDKLFRVTTYWPIHPLWHLSLISHLSSLILPRPVFDFARLVT
jgi:hypothetical protein